MDSDQEARALLAGEQLPSGTKYKIDYHCTLDMTKVQHGVGHHSSVGIDNLRLGSGFAAFL